jgi:hypothetical protein
MPDWIAERYSDQFDDTDTAHTADSEDDEPTALPARDPGYGHEFDVTVSVVNDGEYSREAQGRLEGPQGLYISYVVPGGNDISMSVYEHSTVHMDSVTLRTNDDGLLEAVITDAVDIERIDDDSSSDSPDRPEAPHRQDTPPESDTEDGEATADGGVQTDTQTDADTTQTDTDATASQSDAQEEERTDPTEMSQAERLGKIKGKLRYSDEPLTAAEIAEKLAWKVSKTEATLELLAKKSKSNVIERSDGYQMI